MFKIQIARKFWFPKTIDDVKKYFFEAEIHDGNSKRIYPIEPRLVCERMSGKTLVFSGVTRRDFSVEVLKSGNEIFRGPKAGLGPVIGQEEALGDNGRRESLQATTDSIDP